MIEQRLVIRADLGVTRVFATKEGLLVLVLSEDGPAERSGIEPIRTRLFRQGSVLARRLNPETADLIVAVDGKRVKSAEELLSELEACAPGVLVTITVIRDGRSKDLKVQLGQS